MSLLRLKFDELFPTHTGYEALDDRIAKMATKIDELLTVLLVPGIPLHNNGSELQTRVIARRRAVGLHSRSVRGARAMAVFTTVVQTSEKLVISVYAYLCDQISHHYGLSDPAQTAAKATSVSNAIACRKYRGSTSFSQISCN